MVAAVKQRGMDNCQLADGTARLCSELRQPNVLIPCKLLSEDGTVISENGERLQLNDGETIYLPTDSVKLLDEAEETYHSASEIEWSSLESSNPNFARNFRFFTPKNSRKIIALKTNPRNFTDCDKFMLRYGVKKFGENWKFLLEHFVWSVPWMEEDLEAEWNDIKDEQS
uniref:SET domain-containing protein n=1 Tax=Trichuris muris TaxID=70415 RepID=A0A5S6QPX3_TRIMR